MCRGSLRQGRFWRATKDTVNQRLNDIRPGLALVLLGLVFGIALGLYFGINEEAVQAYIAQGIAANPALHDPGSQAKIWRYVQRAHFHATGIAAYSLGLVLLIAMSDLAPRLKAIGSVLIGLGCLYPLAWFTTFYLAPSLGRDAAHEHWLTLTLVYVSTAGAVAGLALVVGNVFLRFGAEPA
jgi:hypothetical protein